MIIVVIISSYMELYFQYNNYLWCELCTATVVRLLFIIIIIIMHSDGRWLVRIVVVRTFVYIYYKLKCVVAARAPPRVIICICMSRNARNAGGCDGNVDVKPTYDINEIILLLLLLLYCATSRLSY